jgi:hypothetical protein
LLQLDTVEPRQTTRGRNMSEPHVEADPDGGVVVTIEYSDDLPTIISIDSPRDSVVLRFIARTVES